MALGEQMPFALNSVMDDTLNGDINSIKSVLKTTNFPRL